MLLLALAITAPHDGVIHNQQAIFGSNLLHRSAYKSYNMMTTRHLWVALVLLLLAIPSSAFSATPVFGIGAVLFKGVVKTIPTLGDERILEEAADFFVDAFWQAKVGGGTKKLTGKQRKDLLGSQTMEFRRRYGAVLGQRKSELVVARNAKNELMGVCAIEVEKIPDTGRTGKGPIIAPLMSNVAVGQQFRRRGIAEDLVKEVEEIARKDWGYNEVYLYVEQRNKAAVNLYQKLGYRKIWVDNTSRTMVPTVLGGWESTPTLLVCMKKDISRGFLGRFLPF